MKYGLIGKNISYSYSKLIHSYINKYDYDIYSLNEDEVVNLLKTKDFLGINVTIPYKKLVIEYLDEISDEVKNIHACNCIVNQNGILKGYNTDYYGLKNLIINHSFHIAGSNCYILGSGGTKNTAYQVLTSLKAKKIIVVSRNKTNDTISYEEFFQKDDVDYIINTTPVGTYPNIDQSILSLEILKKFTHLKGIIDVIYNPLNTRLTILGKSLSIPSINGLEMLIDQGLVASEKFINQNLDKNMRKDILQKIKLEKTNIVLIGLPMSGKSTIGKELAINLKKTFVDIDEEIIKEEKMSINEIFAQYGEVYFRNKETNMIKKYASGNNLVISCGGGVILNEENMFLLKANGFIIHLCRHEDLLIYSSTRPLTKSQEDYQKLKKVRIPLYQKYMDKEIDNSSSIADCLNKIKEAFYESINY